MATIISIRCSSCGEVFESNATQLVQMGLRDFPRKCPKCLDEFQIRPDVTLARTEIFSVTCRISSLPGEWQRVEHPDDHPSWRMVIKGGQFGASWSGRIDLWTTSQEPPQVGDTVRLVEMEVKKRVAKKYWSRPTLEYGVVAGWRQISLSDYVEGNPDYRIEEEVRRYIRLDPAPDEDPQGRQLVWVTAYTKNTLKGFGRQFWASLEGSPIWHQEVVGGARSGRFHTTGWLAVVDPDNPVFHNFTESGHTEIKRIPAEQRP